jgi:hypothetical protein
MNIILAIFHNPEISGLIFLFIYASRQKERKTRIRMMGAA